jgi:hypothetical protein
VRYERQFSARRNHHFPRSKKSRHTPKLAAMLSSLIPFNGEGLRANHEVMSMRRPYPSPKMLSPRARTEIGNERNNKDLYYASHSKHESTIEEPCSLLESDRKPHGLSFENEAENGKWRLPSIPITWFLIIHNCTRVNTIRHKLHRSLDLSA